MGSPHGAPNVGRRQSTTPDRRHREDILSTLTRAEEPRAVRTHPKPRWYWITVGILLVVIAATFWPAMTEGAHRPSVNDFFPTPIFGDGTFFSFNRITLARVLVGVVVCLLLGIAASRLRLVPTRGQQVLELLAEFVRRSICIDMLGEARGRRYAPLIGVIFIGVLGMNLTGTLPGINIAASSVMAVPLVFAVLAYVGFITAGVKAHGAGKFLVSQLFPPGVPKAIYLLITPIEFFSTFIVRPATLAIRLLANMVSGHFLLAMTYFGTSAMLAASSGMKGIAVLTGAAAVVVTLFEIFIAALQAYIFAVLTTVYIKMSVESH